MKEEKFNYYEADKKERFPMSERTDRNGIPLLQEGAFNIYTSIPCPVLSRFKRGFQSFIEEYNRKNETPIYSATLAGLDWEEMDDMLKTAQNTEELPEALVLTGTNWQFRNSFRRNFIETGLYKPYCPPDFARAMPKKLQELSEKYAIGFLAFGSWDLLYDLSFGEDGPFPKTWFDLSKPEFKGKITMHSCDDCGPGCVQLLSLLKKKGGSEALSAFAGNISALKHFAEILKTMSSGKAGTTPFNIIPGPAASQAPSTKRIARLELRDGILPMLVSVLVKQDRMDNAEKALSFFYSPEFRKILKKGSLVPADEIGAECPYILPDWEGLLADDDPDNTDDLLKEEFMAGFPGAAAGAVCCK